MNTAANRFRRLMILLPLFAERHTWSLEELARTIGEKPQTVRGDLRALVENHDDIAGVVPTVIFCEEGDEITLLVHGFYGPLLISPSELATLELGLTLLGRDAAGERGDAIRALRDRLHMLKVHLPGSAWPPASRHGSVAGQGEELATLRDALRECRVVELDYRKPTDAEASTRAVRPWALLMSRGAWYLVAWCEREADRRVFRVDRIDAVRETDRSYEIPEDFSVDDVVINGAPYLGSAQSPMMTLRYSPVIARWIAERDGLPLEADGSAVRTMPLADRAWAIRHVLQYGSECRIVEPEDLRRELVQTLEGMAGSLS